MSGAPNVDGCFLSWKSPSACSWATPRSCYDTRVRTPAMKPRPQPAPRGLRSDALPGPAPSDSRFGRAAAVIFLAALVVRVIHVWQIRNEPFFTVLMGDARGYDDWARQIAGGDWLGYEVFYQAPLYPYFLGVLYSVVGRDLVVVRVCQAVIGSLACVLLGLAGWRLFSSRTGLIAGLMLAFYAPAVFFDALIQKSVLDVFFICLMLWLIGSIVAGTAEGRFHGDRTVWGKLRPWLGLGLAIGALSLTRENALAFLVVVLAWALGARPSNPERAPSRRAARAVMPQIIGVFAGGAGLLGACAHFSDTLLEGRSP